MTAAELAAFALCLAVGLAFAAFVLRGLARLAWAIVGRVWARAAGYDGHVFAVSMEDGRMVIHHASEKAGRR